MPTFLGKVQHMIYAQRIKRSHSTRFFFAAEEMCLFLQKIFFNKTSTSFSKYTSG